MRSTEDSFGGHEAIESLEAAMRERATTDIGIITTEECCPRTLIDRAQHAHVENALAKQHDLRLKRAADMAKLGEGFYVDELCPGDKVCVMCDYWPSSGDKAHGEYGAEMTGRVVRSPNDKGEECVAVQLLRDLETQQGVVIAAGATVWPEGTFAPDGDNSKIDETGVIKANRGLAVMYDGELWNAGEVAAFTVNYTIDVFGKRT